MTAFLGIYKAIYKYDPQSPEELAIDEDDLLYLLQKSDVDNWWTVKKRVIGPEADEPTGLVPNNYIEEAPVISTARAIYDYLEVQNPDEELVFHENEVFDVFDDRDPDWILCRSQTSNEVGFVPGNYVESASGASGVGSSAATTAPSAPAAPVAAPLPPLTTVDISQLPPPPQHVSRSPEAIAPKPDESTNAQSERYIAHDDDVPPAKPARPVDDDYEIPPPKPSRPVDDAPPAQRSRPTTRDSYGDYDDEYRDDPRDDQRFIEEEDSSAFHTWSISEVDGRKKRKAKLAIGKNTIFFTPSKGSPQQWAIEDLNTYDNEKKHIFLEFSNPYANIEIHTGSTDVANEIMFFLSELKGASRAGGLREVEAASKSSSKKQGKIIYDFVGESPDELTVKEGQMVYILNDKKSKDWWMCELVETGKQGVVPAQFVEPSSQLSSMMGTLKKFGKSPKKKSPPSGNWKDDVEQDIPSKKKSSRRRASSFLHSKKKDKESSSKKDKEFPDPKKTRIWVDRSGTFKVEAEFIGCVDGKIHLHKANGVKIAVAADKLSPDDLLYVERTTGMSLDKFKTKSSSGASARDKERERRRKLKEQEEKEREREEREYDRRLREQELEELRKTRDLLDKERQNLKSAQSKELPPIKPPRPTTSTSNSSRSVNQSRSQSKQPEYDWFEFFLNCGVDVNNCQRYTINFEREQISEEILPDIQPSLLRTLGLREGDIIRVMKFLDHKFGRETLSSTATGGLFSEPDGSLKVSQTQNAVANSGVSDKLLPQHTAPASSQTASAPDDEAWTVRPAAKSEASLPPQKSEFTGSMQDLLDLQPLEPKKAPASSNSVPQPNLKDLEAVKTGSSSKTNDILLPNQTGMSLAPLDPFKTGGHNILPMATGFVMMPMATGGLLPLQRTGGMVMPQTSFGIQPTGSVLPVQKTSGGLIPVNTGALMPQTTFGVQPASGLVPLQRTGGALPLQQPFMQSVPTGGLLPQNTNGGLMPLQRTGGIPQTSFGMQPTGGILPQTTSGTMPLQRTGGLLPLPQTSFGVQNTTIGTGIPQTSFGAQMTGGMTMPQTSFMSQITGGANMMPQTSFGNQMTGGANMMPQSTFNTQITGGPANVLPQNTFGLQQTGGPVGMQRTGGGVPLQSMSLGSVSTGGFQPQSQFGLNIQRTGGLSSLPQTSFSTGGPLQSLNGSTTGGMNQMTNMFQNTSISQPALQSQPTGFGFGNGPQAQGKQANLFNATADNPFGF
ncbi:LAFE_0D03202g1_1 [Lachancea fermentati]|uniref:Actin cytoskeleton-regulatory complex protein SLA1 n=1 Tax=Lachancea fermentati TaxID=4955 RepID=A0A1G4MAU1_LACFM|nr:LAFE_0D03202g1_1 [Lachancea fermentati]